MKKFNLFFYVLIEFTCLYSFSITNVFAHDLHYEPALSDLVGLVKFQKYYSQQPPYYEQKDNPRIVEVLVFIPDQPIDVVATTKIGPDQDSFYGVKIIQLSPPDTYGVERFLGQRVRLSGYLSERTTGFYYTDIIFTVTSIRQLTN